jgi:Lon protease-like protein
MKLPHEVPVMPLPNAVLFPRVMLPLYIFEPRYRQMLADCLHGQRMFCVALLRKGWEHQGRNPTPYPIAGLGVIRTCVGRPDGTSHLVLEGVARVRVRRYVRVRPYRVAEIEPLPSEGLPVPAPSRPLVNTVSRLARARALVGAEVPKAIMECVQSVRSADYLTDLVSYTLLEDYHQKQRMLETLDVNQRLEKLVDLLQQQIQQFELWKTLQGKLPNKHVGHN